MAKYSIGLDFGTLSGRALLLNLETGEELASAVCDYPHGVMDREMPWGEAAAGLGAAASGGLSGGALQDDSRCFEGIRRAAGGHCGSGNRFHGLYGASRPERRRSPVFSAGICTESPRLCETLEASRGTGQSRPYHGACQAAGEAWLQDYGGRVSSEWMFPSCGSWPKRRLSSTALCTALWKPPTGLYGSSRETRPAAPAAGLQSVLEPVFRLSGSDFFKAPRPKKWEHAAEKLGKVISPLGERAGGVTAEMAHRTGLREGTAVSVGNVDAHVCVPAAGISGPGNCWQFSVPRPAIWFLGTEGKRVPGVCGMVKDGILPGYFGFEAGQSCVGDLFSWFLNACLPASCREEAFARGKSLHEYLREKAQKLKPGESGLLALDWWNGNRSILTDGDLTGLLLGMTLQTRPEELYRALIEATAYGTRILVENYREHGVPVEEFVAAGGISRKDPMTMQIYADVLNMPVLIVGTHQGWLSAAPCSARWPRAGKNGGFSHILEAAGKVGKARKHSVRSDSGTHCRL